MRAWLLAPACATFLGVIAWGPWAIVGGLTGAATWLLLRRMDAPMESTALAASLPPLVATGPVALVPLLGLGSLLLWLRTGQAAALLLPAAGLVLPPPGGTLSVAASVALLAALAPVPFGLLALPLAFAPLLLKGTIVGPVAALMLGVAARALAAHPANATASRFVGSVGLALLPLPALAAFALAALEPASVAPLALMGAALLLGVIGSLLLAAHLGLASLFLADDAAPAGWTGLTWALIVAGALAMRTHPPIALAPLLGVLAVPIALAAAWRRPLAPVTLSAAPEPHDS